MRKVSRKYMNGYKVYDTKKIILVSALLTMMALGVMLIYDMALIRFAIAVGCLIIAIIYRKKLLDYFGLRVSRKSEDHI